MELSRLLRKPRKRNAAGFFRRPGRRVRVSGGGRAPALRVQITGRHLPYVILSESKDLTLETTEGRRERFFGLRPQNDR